MGPILGKVRCAQAYTELLCVKRHTGSEEQKMRENEGETEEMHKIKLMRTGSNSAQGKTRAWREREEKKDNKMCYNII